MAKTEAKAAGQDSGKTQEQKAAEPRDRRARMEAAEPQTTVDLRRARTFRGRAYGPGRGISIPTRIAKALGLTEDSKASRTAARRRKA